MLTSTLQNAPVGIEKATTYLTWPVSFYPKTFIQTILKLKQK